MIASLLYQDDTGAPVVLCKANARTKQKHAAACYAAQVAFLRIVYGYQPTKGVSAGYISNVTVEGSIVAIEVAFPEHDFYKGMFEVPVHAIQLDGQDVSTTSDTADWIGRHVLLNVTNRYKLDGVFLSNIAAIDIDGSDKQTEAPCELLAELEA